MKNYLKMADVFGGAEVNVRNGATSLIDCCGVLAANCLCPDTANHIAHAINSHDELVQMNQELLEALEDVIDDKAPLYHDCIDNGESECGWCIARKAIAKAKAKGGAA